MNTVCHSVEAREDINQLGWKREEFVSGEWIREEGEKWRTQPNLLRLKRSFGFPAASGRTCPDDISGRPNYFRR